MFEGPIVVKVISVVRFAYQMQIGRNADLPLAVLLYSPSRLLPLYRMSTVAGL